MSAVGQRISAIAFSVAEAKASFVQMTDMSNGSPRSFT